SMELVGDLVLIGGDRLTAVSLANGAQRWQGRARGGPHCAPPRRGARLPAVSLANGAQRWQAAPRGAHIAGTPDGRLIIAASGEGIVALSGTGALQWQVDIPSEFVDAA